MQENWTLQLFNLSVYVYLVKIRIFTIANQRIKVMNYFWHQLFCHVIPLSQKKKTQMLKERLFPVISWKYSKWAGNIIGMLLKFDNSELLYMFEYQEVLEARAKEVVAQLETLQFNTSRHQIITCT